MASSTPKPGNSSPVQRPGDGPGRWNDESGARPSTATSHTHRRPTVKAS